MSVISHIADDRLLKKLALNDTDSVPPSLTRQIPLPPPAALLADMPLTQAQATTVQEGRQSIRRILRRQDNRILIVLGPCSIHDTDAALDYAERLARLQATYRERFLFVMRAYLEKPRTTVGWRGLVNDPHLDGSYDMAEGLWRSRGLLRQITDFGLPVATELLDISVPNYLGDLVSFAAIGARTTESQPHRALASGLPVPVGFKNGTDGGVQVALDAMVSAREAHSYLGMDEEGRCCIHHTPGNRDTLLILRGGKKNGPNYDADSVQAAEAQLEKLGFVPNLMVDCSHANSGYDPARQSEGCRRVAEQRKQGNRSLIGLMLESHIHDGKQPLIPGNLQYGVSVTDACLGWENTVCLMEEFASAI